MECDRAPVFDRPRVDGIPAVAARRKLIVALGTCALGVPLTCIAQKPGKVWRIGFLCNETPAGYAKQIEALRAGLRDYGFIEGKSLVLETRWAQGKIESLPKLAAELVQRCSPRWPNSGSMR